MYRYWRELTTVGGQSVNYSETEILKLFAISQGLTGLSVPSTLLSQYATFRLQLLGDKGVEAGQPTGQSLIAPDAVVDVRDDTGIDGGLVVGEANDDERVAA